MILLDENLVNWWKEHKKLDREREENASKSVDYFEQENYFNGWKEGVVDRGFIEDIIKIDKLQGQFAFSRVIKNAIDKYLELRKVDLKAYYEKKGKI